MTDRQSETTRLLESAGGEYERIQREFPGARVKAQALIKKRLSGAESVEDGERFVWCDLLVLELPDGREVALRFEFGEPFTPTHSIPVFLRRPA